MSPVAEHPEPEPMCDHICIKDEGHVDRGEPHFYGYEIPSPRADRVRERFARLTAENERLRTDLAAAHRRLVLLEAVAEAVTSSYDYLIGKGLPTSSIVRERLAAAAAGVEPDPEPEDPAHRPVDANPEWCICGEEWPDHGGDPREAIMPGDERYYRGAALPGVPEPIVRGDAVAALIAEKVAAAALGVEPGHEDAVKP